METKIWINIGSGNGLLPDDTKPLPEPMLTNHQWGILTFIWEQFHSDYARHYSVLTVWKLNFWKFWIVSQGPMSYRLLSSPLMRNYLGWAEMSWVSCDTTVMLWITCKVLRDFLALLGKKHVHFCNHCICCWPGTVWCHNICKHNDEDVRWSRI